MSLNTLTVAFGATYAGLTTVGYTLYDRNGVISQLRTTSGVYEIGGGVYGVLATLPVEFSGTVYWDTALASPISAAESIDRTTPSVRLTADGLDAVSVEHDLNARQALSLLAATLAGVLTGAGTSTVTIRAAGTPGTVRITAQVSGGNRNSLTLNPPT